MIEARGVTVRRGGRSLVADVSLSASPGEILGMIGPNGAGKTTLLRVLSGELIPNAGRASIAGKSLGAWHPARLARMRAVLPQASSLSFPFLLHEVVALGALPGQSAAAVDRCVAAALDTVGLTALAERPFTVLSGGERQRVHFARILTQLAGASLASPAVCLLDEPVAALDPRHQHCVLQCVRDLAERGVAVIMVLHDLSLAARYADRLLLLSEGTIAATGSPREVLDAATLERAYQIRFATLRGDDGALIVMPNPLAA